MPTADLRELTVPPELTTLQAQLAQQAVIDEMAIPGGLRFDEPVVDPLSQFKADVREVLAQHPPTLDTQLVAQYISDAMYVVPKAETLDDTAAPPEAVAPELLQLQPDTAPDTVTDVGVIFVGGPFNEYAEVVVDDVVQATSFLTESTVSARIAPLSATEASSRDCFVRQGADETAHLAFAFTHTDEPLPESVEEQQRRDAGPVTYAGSGPVEPS